jgi:hypothetical protein
MNAKTEGCEHCNKSKLSLLLLRPSPVAGLATLAPTGSSAVVGDAGLTDPLLPSRKPTESRTVLRLLRQGFVHVYIPNPPKPLSNWLVYQVNDNGDVHPHTHPAFNPQQPPAACARDDHNALGSRLLTLPQAHKIASVWIAFSANLWSDQLRADNAANPNVMRQVFIGGGGPHTFKPTAQNLETKVLEFGVSAPWRHQPTDHDFAFASLQGEAQAMATVMKNAAAGHPETIDKELAVVLPDPVGYASELNALRLRRQALAVGEMAKPENAHPFNSSHLLMGLRQVVIDVNRGKGWDTVAPVVSRATFDDLMRMPQPNVRGWPAGSEWHPLDASRENLARYGYGQGRVYFPDHEQRAAEWAHKQSEATWAAHFDHYDEAARIAWLDTFNRRMDAEHYQPMQKFEDDWWAAAGDAKLRDYFARHFDEHDPNDPKLAWCPGLAYTKEALLARTPAPLTQGKTLEAYVAELAKPITDKTAIDQRALVGNQAEVFARVQAVFDMKPASAAIDHLHAERNDKLYDLGVGLLANAADAKNPNGLQRVAVKYRWLLAEAFGAYTHVIAKSMTAAVSFYGSRVVGSQSSALLERLQGLQLVQRASDLVHQAAVSNGMFRTPVQVTRMLPIHEAMVLLGARGGISRQQVQRASRGGVVAVTVLSDSIELKTFAGNLDELIVQSGGRVHLQGAPRPALMTVPALAGTMALTDEQFKRLWKAKALPTALAAQAMKEAMHARFAVVKAVEGRLALGVILINGVGLQKALSDLGSDDRAKVRDAWVGTLDSGASVVAGGFQVLEVAAKESISRRLGAQAVGKVGWIYNVRAAAAGLGAFAAVVSGVGQGLRGKDARSDGQAAKAAMLYASATAFGGLAYTGLLATVGAIADKQVAKGVASVFMRRMAARYGAAGAATLLGVSMSGWGLILLGGALTFEAGAILLTPTALQEWMRRSYFGKGAAKDRFAKGDWEAELRALEAMFDVSNKAEAPEPAAPAVEDIAR